MDANKIFHYQDKDEMGKGRREENGKEYVNS